MLSLKVIFKTKTWLSVGRNFLKAFSPSLTKVSGMDGGSETGDVMSLLCVYVAFSQSFMISAISSSSPEVSIQ